MKKALRCLLPLALVAVLPAAAEAQRRPDASRMSCASARALVVRSGAIVLSTGPTTYDRYVHHRGFCTPSEITEAAFIATADGPGCYIGERCIERLAETDK